MKQTVICPWTSTAPLSAMKPSNPENAEATNKGEDVTVGRTSEEENEKKTSANEEKKNASDGINVKPSSSQFFHFLRLMQLFPNVHPATLHTVMTLCKNDFFVAVDKLLYAKRCKEIYQSKMQMMQMNSAGKTNTTQRFSPYSCNTSYCQNVGCIKPQVIKLDAKKIVSRSRLVKIGNIEKQGCSSSTTQPDLTPVNLQCNVPIQPLSPVTSEATSASTSNVIDASHK